MAKTSASHTPIVILCHVVTGTPTISHNRGLQTSFDPSEKAMVPSLPRGPASYSYHHLMCFVGFSRKPRGEHLMALLWSSDSLQGNSLGARRCSHPFLGCISFYKTPAHSACKGEHAEPRSPLPLWCSVQTSSLTDPPPRRPREPKLLPGFWGRETETC